MISVNEDVIDEFDALKKHDGLSRSARLEMMMRDETRMYKQIMDEKSDLNE